MSPGDFILTPNWAPHDHGNPSDKPMLWLDVLDMPTVNHFETSFSHHFEEAVQNTSRGEGDSLDRYGSGVLPDGAVNKISPVINYTYARTRPILERMKKSGDIDKRHGARVRYANPTTGGWALPTMGAHLALLPQGFKGEPYRSTDGTDFRVRRRQGPDQDRRETFEWTKNDVFVAPPWMRYSHMADKESVLFSISDRPMQEALGIWREGQRIQFAKIAAGSGLIQGGALHPRSVTATRRVRRGALARVADEIATQHRAALVIATPGSGERLGARVAAPLGTRSRGSARQGSHSCASAVADAGLAAAKEPTRTASSPPVVVPPSALPRYIARDTGLPILAVPTTYSGSEATPIWGISDGERKMTGSDHKVVPRTIIYDPELTLDLPARVTAASAMNAMAHCIRGLWSPDRTPVTVAYATEAMRRFGAHLPRVVADGCDPESRGECLIASWLAGTVLTAGTGLNHKLAHVLGGYGLPHAETHAVLLPHTTRFNLVADADASGAAFRGVA